MSPEDWTRSNLNVSPICYQRAELFGYVPYFFNIFKCIFYEIEAIIMIFDIFVHVRECNHFHLISLSKFNLPLLGTCTWPTPPGPYRATTCRGRELNCGSHTYFFDHTRTWRASPDEWSAQCRGHLRDSTNMKDNTHSVITTRRIWNDDYDGQMILGDLGGLKFPDICLSGEEKPRKTSPRKPVSTGNRTRARCVTSAHATTCSTAVDQRYS